MAAIRFENVVKRYGEVTAVGGVSFTISPGELVTLLGPSGCGKTTSLRMLAGLESVTDGNIFIADQDVTPLSATDRDVAMVFQNYALFPHMSVRDNVGYGLRVGKSQPDAQWTKQAEAALERVGLTGMGSRMPHELSGGQQQRVAVARALVLEPQVLLFDEPLSNLDAKLRRKMRTDIRLLQQDLGVTSVYVTHDQDEALAISDRIIVMNNGAIEQMGSPRELYDQPASEFVASFMGDSNLLPAEIDSDGTLHLGEVTLPAPGDAAAGKVTLVVRPHAVRLSDASAPGLLKGTVVTATYLGDQMEYGVQTPPGELFVTSAGTDAPRVQGDEVSITFEASGVSVVRGA